MSKSSKFTKWVPQIKIAKSGDPEVLRSTEAATQPRDRRTKCLHCMKWFTRDELQAHLDEVNRDFNAARQKDKDEKAQARAEAAKTKPAPTPNVGKGSKNHTKHTDVLPEKKMPYRGQPQNNGSDRPAAGIDDGLSQLMNLWSTRVPADFIIARKEAEDMGEAWRSVADAFRRRADLMVEEVKVAPDCVEPFHEAAGIASRLADCHMEVANRIAARYEKEIEFVNDPNSPDSEFLTQH